MLYDPKEAQGKSDVLFRSKESKFQFDLVLDTDSKQQEVYEATGVKVVEKVLSGQ